MLFVIHGLDKLQSPLRKQLIDQHRSYLAESPVTIVSSGPLLNDIDGQIIGSLVIVDCAHRAEVDALMADEPFNRAGLYESLHINRWQQRSGSLHETSIAKGNKDNATHI